MLTPYLQSRFIEKIVTDAYGRQFRAIFFVSLVDGEVRGRVVSIQPMAQSALALEGAVSDGALCLPAWASNEEICTPYFAPVTRVASPYFTLDFFLSSQQTRAPSAF